jgi:hypothetical protein
MTLFNQQITFILTQLQQPKDSLTERIRKTSAYFLGQKYKLNALGEGKNAVFDKNPLYRTDAFDCLTYVSTVLALAKANTKQEFIKNLKQLNYKEGKVNYFSRHHIMETDWNVICEKKCWLTDITSKVSSHYKVAEAVIDKASWYQRLPMETLQVLALDEFNIYPSLLNKLNSHIESKKPSLARTKYIPLTLLFNQDHNELYPNQTIFARIPSCCVVEIIDKNRATKDKIGTDLNIVHLGFAIRQKDQLIFRHAARNKEVLELPLVEYLKRYYQFTENPERVGIHVMRILSLTLPSPASGRATMFIVKGFLADSLIS